MKFFYQKYPKGRKKQERNTQQNLHEKTTGKKTEKERKGKMKRMRNDWKKKGK